MHIGEFADQVPASPDPSASTINNTTRENGTVTDAASLPGFLRTI